MSKTNLSARTALVQLFNSEGDGAAPASSGTKLGDAGPDELGRALTSLSGKLDPFLRIEIVTAVIGLSVPTVYRLMAKGDFPRPIKLTSSARAWKLSDIIDWMQSRAAARGPSEERA